MATLIIKNIPLDIYERLKRRAKANSRSINQEVIAVIERALATPPIDVDSTLERTRKILIIETLFKARTKKIQLMDISIPRPFDIVSREANHSCL